MSAKPLPRLTHSLTWQMAWFDAFRHIRQLDFHARSGPSSQMQWNHRGSGRVAVTVEGQDLHFEEHFTLDNGLPCTDRKCWRFTDQGIMFRHWRQQQFQDVLLLVPDETGGKLDHLSGAIRGTSHRVDRPCPDTMAPDRPAVSGSDPGLLPSDPGPIHLTALSPYSCPPDLYDGTFMRQGNTLILSLRITGTRKDEHIRYLYRHSGHQTGLDGPSR